MHDRPRWLTLNLLLLAGILMLAVMEWRRSHPVAAAPGGAESAGGAVAEKTDAPVAAILRAGGDAAWTAQPVVYGRQQSSQPQIDPFAIREQGLLRAGGWESLPCQPAIDLADTGDDYVLMLSADNVTLDSVRLRLDGAVLTVMTQRRFHGGEISLARRIMLPAAPDPALAPHCSLTNGALRIRLAKRRP